MNISNTKGKMTMNNFTWTYADIPLKINKTTGDYAKKCVLQYEGFGVLLKPDSKNITEICYKGKGIFNKNNVFELAAEWNRPYIADIIKKNEDKFKTMKDDVKNAAIAYSSRNEAALKDLVANTKNPLLKRNYKKAIGEAITRLGNDVLKYPVKIMRSGTHGRYAEYPASKIV